jgi:hypothetical protein
MALFAVRLPQRDITVTASAQKRIDRPEAPLWETSWVLDKSSYILM